MALTKVSPSLFATSNNITSVTVGGSANTISLTFDASGVITSASNNAVSVANTAITGNIISSQITSVANTQLTGTITGSQISSNTLSNTVFQTGSVENYMNATGLGFGMRNRIINGAMVIDQRNAGASVTLSGSSQYPIDRYIASLDTSATVTAQQSSTAPTGFTNSLLISVTSGTAPSAGNENRITQRIEGFNTADLGFGTATASTVTLSFWVRCSLTGTFSGSLRNSTANRSYPFTYTISTANTFEYKTITIAGDTSGTWIGATNGTGLQVTIDIGSGSTMKGTANAWASANYLGATGSTNLIATTGATFYITGVQLEKGSTATSFDYRPYGTELALCQRYYAKTFPQTVAPANNLGANYYFGYSVNTANPSTIWKFPVTMRSAPTLTLFNDRVGGTAGQWNTGTIDSANARALGSSTEFVMFDNTAVPLGTTTNWWLGGATAAIEL